MKVYKNNIVKIALKNAQLPEIENLEGTCAYVFFEKDPVDAAKVIKKQSESPRFNDGTGAEGPRRADHVGPRLDGCA